MDISIKLRTNRRGGGPVGGPPVILAPAISNIVISEVTETSFRITAMIDPGGDTTIVTVRYGPNSGYGLTQNIVTGSPANQAGQISALISNLTANTTYHFSIRAINSADTVDSNDATQATLEHLNQAPVISGHETILADEGRVVGMIGLFANVNPGGLVTVIQMQYGRTMAYELGIITLADIAAGSADVLQGHVLSKLKPGKYHYRWVAENSEGLVFSPNQNFHIYPGVGIDGVDYSATLAAAIADMTGASFYVDPSSIDPVQDGTIAHPHHSWTAFPELGGNNRYYQKRGTTYAATTGTLRNINGPCLIGAYGEGEDYAYMTCVPTAFTTFIYAQYRLVAFDLDIMGSRSGGPGTEVGRGIRLSAYESGATMNHFIYNCKAHRFDRACDSVMSNGYFYGYKVIHCEFYDTFIENMYPDGATDFEIAYCNLHDANNAWFINEDQNTSRGDNMQIALANTNFPTVHLVAYIHHNSFDRTTTANKFCLIWNETRNGETIYVYNNVFRCPEYNAFPGHPVSAIYNGLPNQPITDPSTAYIYNNIFIGGEYGVRNYERAGTFIHNNIFIRQDKVIATGNGRSQNIYNNIFWEYLTVAIGMVTDAQVRSKNNVFNTSSALAYAYSGTFPVELIESDYNNYSQGRIVSSAYGLAEWRAENAGRDVNSDAENPLFADPDNYDFRIPANSPLKGSGVAVGLTHDFAGVAIAPPISKGIYQ